MPILSSTHSAPVCKSLLGGTLQEGGGVPRNLTIPLVSRFPVSGLLHSLLLRFALGVSMGEKGGVTLAEKRELLVGPTTLRMQGSHPRGSFQLTPKKKIVSGCRPPERCLRQQPELRSWTVHPRSDSQFWMHIKYPRKFCKKNPLARPSCMRFRFSWPLVVAADPWNFANSAPR